MHKLLTTQAVALRLNLSKSQVARLAASGALPVAYQGPGKRGALAFDPAAVDAYLADRESRRHSEQVPA